MMVKRGRKPKGKIEIADYNDSKICPWTVYCDKTDEGNYQFIDIRTLVKYDSLSKIERCDNFTEVGIDVMERWKRYRTSKFFDLDYNQTARKSYKFRIMNDLYQVLWNYEDNPILDSGETLISPNKALIRGKGSTEYDKKRFVYSIATIGNFMPIPSSNQALLKGLEERFDKELNLIKAYFYSYKSFDYSNDFVPETLNIWLKQYVREYSGKKAWEIFVENNYLMNSFVDESYNVVPFDGSLSQLSGMIYSRSVIMIEEYKKRMKSQEKVPNHCNRK